MEQIQFTITAKEVRKSSPVSLTNQQIKEILCTIENDGILWEKIEESVQSSIQTVLNKQ